MTSYSIAADTKQSKRFFDLPLETKSTIAHAQDGENNRGYLDVGISTVSQMVFDSETVKNIRQMAPECRESLEIGNPNRADDQWFQPNRWLPEDTLPGFRAFIEVWWEECTRLEKALLRCLSRVLNLEDINFMCDQQREDVCHISFNHYPKMPITPLKNRQVRRINAHSDHGTLTLLFQDGVGGLEVHDGEVFRPVAPRKGSVVINIGDMLEMMSNGRWKSALHQVTTPTLQTIEEGVEHDGMAIDRFSIMYFGQPDPDASIGKLPGCHQQGKWTPNMVMEKDTNHLAGEWLSRRRAQLYAY